MPSTTTRNLHPGPEVAHMEPEQAPSMVRIRQRNRTGLTPYSAFDAASIIYRVLSNDCAPKASLHSPPAALRLRRLPSIPGTRAPSFAGLPCLRDTESPATTALQFEDRLELDQPRPFRLCPFIRCANLGDRFSQHPPEPRNLARRDSLNCSLAGQASLLRQTDAALRFHSLSALQATSHA